MPRLTPLHRLAGLGLAFVLFYGLLPFSVLRSPTVQADQSTPVPDKAAVWRVYITDPAQISLLTSGGWDLVEGRGPDYLLVVGNTATAEKLRALGFTVTLDHYAPKMSPAHGPDTYYGGYRTVVEHYQHLDTISNTYPNLALVVDYGDTWRKVQNSANGYDLKAICITQRQAGDCALNPNAPKPRFFIMAAIHARELSTAELLWRWMDYLVNNYNLDPEVTALLNSTEVWVVPVVNPDGRYIVETGGNNPYYQRKNANNTAPAPTPQPTCTNPPTTGGSNHIGVDLNRNANFLWSVEGSSSFPCDQTYHGASAASEPEEYYLETLVTQLFKDVRPDDMTTAAPLTTTGTFLTLHAYGNLSMLPWGFTTGSNAPNETPLRSLAFRLSYYNGYQAGRPPEILYGVTGATDDWAYGRLGLSSFTFEVGPNSGTCGGFLPAYTCQDSTFWPANRPAFLYMAKTARQPYVTPLGPTAISPTLSLYTVPGGASVTLTVTLNDNAYGNTGVSRPSAQNISAGEYYIDTPPWAGGTPVPMVAQDGAFNANNEVARAVINTTGLSGGRHLLYVRGQDSSGNWGLYAAQFITITAPNAAPTVSPVTNQTTPEDTPLGPLTFFVNDADGQPLTVTASSNNPTLLPNANLALGGSGVTRTLSLTPAADLSGQAVITLAATDGIDTAQRTFTLTVTSVNDAPLLPPFNDYTITVNSTAGPIPFVVSDVDNAANTLTTTATSDNPTLVPATGLVIIGNSGARNLFVAPATGQWGMATITVTVTDGQDATSETFRLYVTPTHVFYVPWVTKPD